MSFLQQVNTPWKMQFFMFLKLPAAWFMGVRVKSCTAEASEVSLPFRWRSQNPFRSTYFAAQCGAAEMSTGLLAMAHIQGEKKVSMLVTHIEAEFYKKADKTLIFTCNEGALMKEAVQKAIETGEGQTFRATSTGTLPDGQIASKVYVLWSFKVKN
ncbi:MAG TPA: DUF4442 domain-containing protein [Saprospiraceae bacterium]|nr:DUF4442 domain-containing protein [Saprospiraceae bacterium]